MCSRPLISIDTRPTSLSRARPKELAHDYLESETPADAERWAARQQHSPTPGQGAEPTNTPSPAQTPDLKIDKDLELRRDGPEDDLKL
jgi:hypothetical protein